MSTPSGNLKTYTGGCHCRAIRYSVALDLSAEHPSATKCNCSICLKTNRIGLAVDDPERDFKLLSPASVDEVAEYRFNTGNTHHRFCSRCGIHCFVHGSYVLEGSEVRHFSINAVTLDPDQEGLDLRGFKIGYWDGKEENWNAGLADKPYPGGTY